MKQYKSRITINVHKYFYNCYCILTFKVANKRFHLLVSPRPSINTRHSAEETSRAIRHYIVLIACTYSTVRFSMCCVVICYVVLCCVVLCVMLCTYVIQTCCIVVSMYWICYVRTCTYAIYTLLIITIWPNISYYNITY